MATIPAVLIVLGMLVTPIAAGCSAWRPAPLAAAGTEASATRGATGHSRVGPASVPAAEARTVSGRVDFGPGRAVQTSPDEVVGAATVSFIDTATNTTVATGKTDGAGRFSLNLGSYTPANGATFLLEAAKGLRGQAPGAEAARLRTILQWNGSAWLSCTNAAAGGPIVINALTTALAIVSALDPGNVPAASTIGKVDASASPATLKPLSEPYPGHPDSELSQLAADLLAYLAADADPLAAAGAIAPAVVSVQPSNGPVGSLVRIGGAGFSVAPGGNTVTFGAAQAEILLATPTALIVKVPGLAATGPVKVQTGRGSATGPSFSVATGPGSLTLSGFSPAEDRAGGSVTLRGTFGAATGSVKLGEVQAKVVRWTEGEIAAEVPFGASSGTWTVRVGGSEAMSADWFTLKTGADLGPFRSAYDAMSFPYPELYGENKQPIVIGDWVYILGGYVQGRPISDVMRAKVRSDGSLAPFQRSGSLVEPVLHHSAIRIGNWVYVIGGCPNGDCTNNTNRVQRARINSDGSLGSFATYSTNVISRHGHNLAVVDGYLYILGGPGAPSIECAKILDADGNLANFAIIGNMPTTRHWAGSAVVGSKIYLFGGTDSGAGILIITVNADGSLGPMTNNQSGMTTSRWGQGVFTYGGAIYNVGGRTSTAPDATYLASVERCTVNADGTLSAGSVVGNLNVGRFIVTPIVTGGHVYVWGGGNGGQWARNLQAVEVAEINADGTLQQFRYAGASARLYGFGAIRVGDKIYMTSGGSDAVEQAQVFPDGGISPFRRVGTLVKARFYGNLVKVGNFLYVVGGQSAIDDALLGSVERAQIGSDGTPGSFALVPQSLVIPRSAAKVKVIGNYIYVTGGWSRTGVWYDSIERAPIKPDGSIGDFEIYQGARLLTARSHHGFVQIGNYCYILGGGNNADNWGLSTTRSVERAQVGPDGTIGPFAAYGNLPRLSHGLESDGAGVVGNYLYIFGAYDGAAGYGGYRNVLRAPITTPDGDLGNWEDLGVRLNGERWHHAALIADGFVYLLGGWNGTSRQGEVEVAAWR